jgi:hypothetical protein
MPGWREHFYVLVILNSDSAVDTLNPGLKGETWGTQIQVDP